LTNANLNFKLTDYQTIEFLNSNSKKCRKQAENCLSEKVEGKNFSD